MPATEDSQGHPASNQLRELSRYLRAGYFSVEGMSSRISARVASSLLMHQTEQGISGPVVEIGAFRGRFAIVLALALAADERLHVLDLFDEYMPGMAAKFRANLSRWSVPLDRVDLWTCNTSTLSREALRLRLGGNLARLIHVDGDHTEKALAHDLALAHAALAPSGLLVVDDMLHPYYPRLMLAVFDFIARHDEYRLLAVVDRASVSGAAKFILCRQDFVAGYATHLTSAFSANFRGDLVEVGDYRALLFTATPWADRFAAAQNAGYRLRYFRGRAHRLRTILFEKFRRPSSAP